MSDNNQENNTLRYILAIIIAVGSFSLLIFLVLINNSKKSLDPFPPYSNGTELNFISPPEKQGESIIANCEEAFVADQYKIFATTNSFGEIISYHRPLAQREGLVEVSGKYNITLDKHVEQPFAICFTQEVHSPVWATKVIVVFDPKVPEQAKFITDNFSNVPANSRIVLVLQGNTVHV